MNRVCDYLCLECGYKWSVPTSNITCPECDHVYIEWTNFDEMYPGKKDEKKAETKNTQ